MSDDINREIAEKIMGWHLGEKIERACQQWLDACGKPITNDRGEFFVVENDPKCAECWEYQCFPWEPMMEMDQAILALEKYRYTTPGHSWCLYSDGDSDTEMKGFTCYIRRAPDFWRYTESDFDLNRPSEAACRALIAMLDCKPAELVKH